MQVNQKKAGFSLIELVIVIAISLLMVGVVSGVYTLRQQVANDNAAQQVASSIQTVRNEAQKGSGDLNPSANPNIQAGDVIYGETIDFNNSCQTIPPTIPKPCIAVKKYLKRLSSDIREYDYSTIEVPEGFRFAYYNSASGTEFASAYNMAGVNTSPTVPVNPACGVAASMILSCGPLSATPLITDPSTGDAFIFVPNLSNKLTLMKKPAYGSAITLAAVSVAQTNVNASKLYLGLTNTDGSSRYYIIIDLNGSNTIEVTKIK